MYLNLKKNPVTENIAPKLLTKIFVWQHNKLLKLIRKNDE